MEKHRDIKIALVGNAQSGKTALFKRYVENAYEDKNVSTERANFTLKEIVHDSQRITLQIWDLPGSGSFRSVHSDYKGINAYLVCIDLTEESALDSATGWVNDIKKIAQSSEIPILLVGTKADLEDKRVISNEQLAQKAQQMNCEGYFTTSAKDNHQIEQVFTRVVELVKPQRENVIYAAYKQIIDKKPMHEKLSFWQRHIRKIIAGIIIGTLVVATITLSLVLPVTVPFLASLGLTIPFTGLANTAALAGIGAVVGLVAGSLTAGITFGIEALVRFCRRKEELNVTQKSPHAQSENTSSKNLTALSHKKNNRSVLNPFNELIETSNYKHAHVLRTNLKQKIADTFFVFAGTLFAHRKNHIGLFDYATLMIPFFIQRLAFSCWLNLNKNMASKILIAPAALIAVPVTIARYVVSGVLTVVALPFTFVTHLISKIVSHKFKKQLDLLPITMNPNSTNGADVRKSTLGEYLRKNNMNLEDINNVEFVDSYNKILKFKTKKTGNSVAFSCEISSEDKTKQSKINALLELNVGGLASKLEDSDAKFPFFATENNSKGQISHIHGQAATQTDITFENKS